MIDPSKVAVIVNWTKPKSNFTSILIKEGFFFFFSGLSLCEEDDNEGDDGVDGGEGYSSFLLPSGWATRRGSSTPLSCLEVDDSSPLPLLNSLYISSTMALMVMKLSMNWEADSKRLSSDIFLLG